MSILGTLGAPFTVLTTATRHAADIDLTFGMASSRFDERDMYRTSYDAKNRFGAGLGTALGTAAPLAGLAMWAQKGFRVPGQTSGAGLMAGRAAAGAALVGMGVVGGLKLKQIVEDDGHLGSVGATAGIIGGFAAGNFVHGSWRGVPLGPVVGLGAAVAGGIGGYIAGSHIHVGSGHLGEHYTNTTASHEGLPGSALDFGRGVANAFNDSGPTTQGISLSRSWGMTDAVEKKMNKSEQAGTLVGDLAAAGVMGGGALAVLHKVMVTGSGATAGLAEKTLANTSLANHVIEGAGDASVMMEGMKSGSSKWGLAALAGAIGLGVAYHEYNSFSDGGTDQTKGLIAGGVTLAAMGAGAVLLHAKLPAFKAAFGEAAPAASALTAAALVGAMSAMRTPIQAFIMDNQAIGRGRTSSDGTTALVGMGVGGSAGALTGFKLASRFAESQTGLRKTAILAGGAIGGAVLGGIVGKSFAPLLPDAKTTGIAAGAGAIALGGASMLLTHNAKSALTAGAAGAALGTVGASLIAPDNKPVEAGSATDVAGSAS